MVHGPISDGEAAPAVRPPSSEDDALLALLRDLAACEYCFVTPTPATHARILARPDRQAARSLRDVLGWSLPFAPELLPPDLLAHLEAADVVCPAADGLLRATIRVSSLDDRLYLHSAYPTDAADAVFFGPDSYRFADLIARELATCPRRHGALMVDIGTGSGVGAIVAATRCPEARVAMTDVNPKALRLARINARAAGVTATPVLGPTLDGIDGPIDIVLANPPYIMDEAGRAYRDGGAMHGAGAARDMAAMALPRLAPGGRFILYTGSAIVGGRDELCAALRRLCDEQRCTLRYREIDPDIFGEELETPAYRDVERIALVAAIATRAG